MKHFITKEQWGELDKKQAKKLIKWCRKNQPSAVFHGHPFHLMNIGEMIEFLGKDCVMIRNVRRVKGYWWVKNSWGGKQEQWELCDALWEAVKRKLYATKERP